MWGSTGTHVGDTGVHVGVWDTCGGHWGTWGCTGTHVGYMAGVLRCIAGVMGYMAGVLRCIAGMMGSILPCADKTLYLMFWKLLRRAILVTRLISLHTLVIYRV